MRFVEADRNLILGTLALQMNFIARDALVAAMNAWMVERPKSLGQILVEQGALLPSRRELLETLVAEHPALNEGQSIEAVVCRAGPGDGPTAEANGGGSTSRPGSGAGSEQTLHYAGRERARADGVSRFVVLRALARGGLGVVSVALDREFNREVALKEILAERADEPGSRDRFLLEAEVTGRLEHPGVVPLYGLGRDAEGRPFYAMRLVKGRTMKEEIERFHRDWNGPTAPGRRRTTAARRGLELRQLLGRFLAVCHTVGYAHSRGVIHRDLKPSNILLGPYGETLVVDWGLAKVVGRPDRHDRSRDGAAEEATLHPSSLSGTSETMDGTAVGTPAYMSPEQAEGRPDRIGPASDVFGLGATFYCLLTGRPPFQGGAEDLFLKIRNGNFPHPRAIDPRIPGPLAAICLKAMAVEPSRRYPSPRALADDIEHWLADEPISVYREPISTRLTRWGRRHRTAAVAIGVLLVTAVLGLAAGTLLLGRANTLVEQQRLRAEETARTLAGQLYVDRINLAQRAWLDADVRRVRELLGDCRPRSPGDPDLRGFEWYYLDHLCGAGYEAFREHVGPVWGVAFSPDGARLASAGGDGAVILRELAGGRAVSILRGHTGMVRAVAFGPGGRRLASVGLDRSIRIRDGRSGRPIATYTANATIDSVAISPDGRRLATGGLDGVITIRDAESGRPLATLEGHSGPVFGLDFAPDGGRLASASLDRTARIWDLATKETVATFQGHEGSVLAVSFSPDGTRVVSCGDERVVRVWDARTGKEVMTLGGHAKWVRAVRYSPDGARIASAGQDQTVRLWDARSGRPIATLRGHTDDVRAVAFHPDGTRLASAGIDGSVNLWGPDAGQDHATLLGHTEAPRGVAFSPDGARLASCGLDGTVRIWDPRSRRPIATLSGHKDWVRDVAFDPRGRYLASASRDGTVRLWDTGRWGSSRTIVGNADTRDHVNALFCLALSPDGARVAAAGADGTVRIWDAATGSLVHHVKGHDRYVWALAFSPDGGRLASAGEDRVVKVWDHADLGRPKQTFSGHEGSIWALAFSPDGRRLATASEDRTVRIWDPRQGRSERILKGHSGQVHGVAFSCDGRRLASAALDGTVRLWDTETGEQLLALTGAAEMFWCVAMSPDGARIVAGDQGARVLLWDSRPDQAGHEAP
jgi:WD40 repeat protein/serine/threonine protein kinase